MIQGNDFSIIASTSHGPEAPTRHLHRPVQDGARRDHGAPPRGDDLRGAARGRARPRPARRLRGLRDGGEGRAGARDPPAQRERVDGRRRRVLRRGRDRRAHRRGRLGARGGRRREPPAGRRAGRAPGHRTGDGAHPRPPPERRRPPHAGPLPPGGYHRSPPRPDRARPGAEPRDRDRRRHEPGRAHEGAARGDRRLLPRTAPELAEARARLRAAELERQAFLAAVPSAYVTTTQEPDVGADPSPGQLARRVGRGGLARGAAVPAPARGGRAAGDPARPRPLADVAREPPHRSRAREPPVEALLRPRPLPDRRGHGLPGRVADPPGAARLARRRVRRERLGREAPDADPRHLGRLPPGLDPGARAPRARPRQPALRPPDALPARRRDGARQRPRRERPALSARWAARASTPISPRATGPT